MFVHFPVGLWTTSIAWDALGWGPLAYWCIAAGLVMAVPAIGTGLYEFMRLERGHPAERVALWHMGAMSGATAFFLGGLLLRAPQAAPTPLVAPVIRAVRTAARPSP